MNDLEIIALGTVSPYPTLNNNCPGFLVKYKDTKILLDCGSGVVKYLNLPKDLHNLKIIITHLHKDHYSDVSSIQYASYVYHNFHLLNNKVKVLLPFLTNYLDIVNTKESFCTYEEIFNDKTINIDGLKITFHDNKSHSIPSFMVKIETAQEKIIYTSDIGSTNLKDAIAFCQDGDLLICESSLLKKDNPANLYHLTAYEAALIAREAKVKKLVLTHFWPEEKKENYVKEAKEIFTNTTMAKEGEKLLLRR